MSRVARDAGVPAVELSADDIMTFMARRGISAATRRTYHVGLSGWFRWVLDEGLREDNPMDRVPKARQGRREAAVATTEHLDRLLAMDLRPKTRTMVLLAAYQGLRASEVARVRGVDLDLTAETITVDGKGGVRATVPLHPVIAREAKKYGPGWWFESRPVGTHVRAGSVVTTVGDAMRRAGVPGSCHSLRHWYATQMLREGVDLRVIQQLMRHATLGTTERYLHVDDTQRRDAVHRLPHTARVVDVDPVVPVGPLCPAWCASAHEKGGHAHMRELGSLGGPDEEIVVSLYEWSGEEPESAAIHLTYDMETIMVPAAGARSLIAALSDALDQIGGA